TFTGNAPGEVSVSPGFDPFSLAKYTEDTQTLLERYLAKSASYQSALLELRSATLDSGYYSLSDAPQLQLSFSLSPYYTGSNSNGFFNSFSELFSDGDPALSFSIGFSATDLFRRSSALQQKSAELALLGSKAKVEQAYEQASDDLDLLVQEIRSYLIDLLIQLEEYQLKRAIYEAEQIRFEANLIDSSALKQKELDWYQAAFTVLSTLRELELRSMQMQLLGLLT
ncbi:MAG: TolC family protein, partial [Spirochaetales bacterium]|nr:TolC family protein [Spirochaetales bacterium]